MNQKFAPLWIVEDICHIHYGQIKKNLSKNPVLMLKVSFGITWIPPKKRVIKTVFDRKYAPASMMHIYFKVS